jgi:hypothetical protein
MVQLSFDETIGSPGATMWDGKYIALDDQPTAPGDPTTIYQATLSGSTLTEVSTTTLTDTCNGTSADIAQPFVVGQKNTPVNKTQGKTVIGGNLDCKASSNNFDRWHYPSGGSPHKTFSLGFSPQGESVSIVK